MKVNEVISKLRVMLGATTEVVTDLPKDGDRDVIKGAFAEATLIDGTEVTTEGELEVGATLYIKVAEGEEAPFAPSGLHETQDGLLVTVGENGEIIAIEEKAQEAPAEESLETEEEIIVEEAMEEEVKEEEAMEEEEKEEEATFDAEGLIEAIAEMIKPQAEELKDLKEKLATLQARFNEVADEPAAKPVKNTFSQVAQDKKSLAEARIEHIISLRKGK